MTGSRRRVEATFATFFRLLTVVPFAAMYPPHEKIWLREQLDPSAVADYERIEQTDEH